MAAFNASQTVGNTIQNILEQTYKNLEIIIVNDGSSDATDAVVKSYQKTHKNIKLLSLKENVGPFKARVIGADNATGDYIHFIDADDHLSIDFYRTTLSKAVESNSDIVIGSIVLDFKNQGYVKDFPLINDLPFDSLSGSNIFRAFMSQGGLNFTYHMNSTKLYSVSLWKKARPFYDNIAKHLIMADDVAMNVPLWFFANRLDRTPTATLFYVKDDNDSATSNYKISYKKMLKNLNDLLIVFDFFETFLDSQGATHSYSQALNNWKSSFVRVYQNNITSAALTDQEKELLLQQLYKIAPFIEDQYWLDTPFFHINTVWRDGLDDLKKKIVQADTETIIFSPNSLAADIPLPNGANKLLPRLTGIELYDLAIFANKKVLLASSEVRKIKKALSLPNLELAEDLDYGAGAINISLPSPVEIFVDRGLNLPFNYVYNPQVPSAMLTVTSMIASNYFDNPYISFINDSAYSGRATSFGYYSVGLQRFIDSEILQNTQTSIHDLLALGTETPKSRDPYEAYIAEAIRYSTERFKDTVGPLLRDTSTKELSNHATAALNLATYTHNWFDRQLLRPLLYKYPRIFANSETSQYAALSPVDHLHHALAGKGKLTKLAVYTLADHGLIIAAMKKRVQKATSRHPLMNKILKNIYSNIKKFKKIIG